MKAWIVATIALVSCSAATGNDSVFEEGGDTGHSSDGGADGSGGSGGEVLSIGGNTSSGPDGSVGTCAEAAESRSYVGCDFWPTPVANIVDPVFDFAVVVANAGTETAEVSVEQGGVVVEVTTVAPDSLAKLYLPWVNDLKGPSLACYAEAMTSSVFSKGSAYHLTSSVPVTVYQFSPLEYSGTGGPPGKNWSSCADCSGFGDCYSYTNDASILLPTTALSGNYRVAAYGGWDGIINSYIAITATEDDTTVKVNLSSTGSILSGAGISSVSPGGELELVLDAGDVAELVTKTETYVDLAGSTVIADKPVQLIGGVPCINIPDEYAACDHIEETIFPVETLGKHYVVTVPTSPGAVSTAHVVRLFGNVDGTALTYAGIKPSGAPAALNAGQVAEFLATDDFEVSGDNEFGVGSYQVGASYLSSDPYDLSAMGDPAASVFVAVEQYRDKYVFLAPSDYDESYVDVVQPIGAVLTLDGETVVETPVPLSGSEYAVTRIQLPLGPNGDGAHVLTSSAPIGIQVMGYGAFTSYQFPGGSNLNYIAPPLPQ